MKHTANNNIWIYAVLVLTGIAFLVISLSTAQEYQEPELPAQEPPYQMYETEVAEVKQDGRTAVVVVYDIYGRHIKVSEKLPFGFAAETTYIWYPNNYLREEGYYESVIQKEEGRLLKDGTEYASYTRVFDETGKRTKSESSGLRIMLPILKVIAQIIGQEIDETEIQDLL